MLYDELVSKAIDNIWVNPHVDRNAIFRTVTVSKKFGAIDVLDVHHEFINLPTSNKRYIVCELGLVNPVSIGVDIPFYNWIPILNLMNKAQLLMYLFVDGRMLNLNNCYLIYSKAGNVIIALDYDLNNSIIQQRSIYIKFYSNAFYSGNNPDPSQKLLVESRTIESNTLSEYLTIYSRVDFIKNSMGVKPIIFINGYFTYGDLPSRDNIKVGDYFLIYNDPLVKDIDAINMDDMESFKSTMDKTRKIIASVDNINDNVFVDDIDFFISGTNVKLYNAGLYLARLYPKFIRMLSYKDWAIDSNIAGNLLDAVKDSDVGAGLHNHTMYLIRRENRQGKSIVLDHNRIMDLHNIPVDVRKTVITGLNANLDVWRADALESSRFINWISKERSDTTLLDITGVYSRESAISMMEFPKPVNTSNNTWELPALASNGGGVLLTFINGLHNTNVAYTDVSHVNDPYTGNGCEIFLPQNVDVNLDTIIPSGDIYTTDGRFNFFVYYESGGKLHLATLLTDYTTSNDGINVTITWSNKLKPLVKYIRHSNNYIFFNISVDVNIIRQGINLTNIKPHINDIGMNSLMVWYNSKYLIEGLDYHVLNNVMYIVGYLDNYTDIANVVVLYGGSTDNTLTHHNKNKYGWVKYGKITDDSIYDICMYRNYYLFIDGRNIPFSEIVEAEGYVDKLRTLPINTILDGRPYSFVKKIQFTRDDELDKLTYPAIYEDNLDKRLSEFLTEVVKQTPTTGNIYIDSEYDLISPTMDAVILDILNGTLDINKLEYSDASIYTLIAPYKLYLNVDPCLKDHDEGYVNIHPSWIQEVIILTRMQYNFLLRVNDVVLKSKVTGLDRYIKITG